jgi:hypothetical protein
MLQLKYQYFDTSDYAKDHFLYSPFNAKVLDMMKDECGGKAALEFVVCVQKCIACCYKKTMMVKKQN